LRITFAAPTTVRGRPEGGGFRIEAELGQPCAFTLQLGFQTERARALEVARNARAAERGGDLGASLRHWSQVLVEFPYEAALVGEAQDTWGRLVREGVASVRGLELEVEHARFFRLADIFRKVRADAVALAARYADTEVEEKAHELVAGIDADLAVLEADLFADERQRLAGILEVLEHSDAPGLAAEVRGYLEERFAPGAAPRGGGGR
jgi:hypothetical protein